MEKFLNDRDVLARTAFLFFLLAVIGLTFSIAVSSIALVAAVVFWLILVGSNPKLFQSTPLDYFFLAYVLAEFLATSFSVDPAASLENAKRLFLISVVYLTLFNLNTRQKFSWAIGLLIGTTALLSVVESLAVLEIGLGEGRLGMFQIYMTAGGMKMIVLLLLLPFLIERSTPSKWRLWTIAAFIPTFGALILTQTRSSWLGFIAGGLALGAIKNRKLLIGLPVVVLIFLLLAPHELQSRAASMFDPSLTSNLTRIHMLQTGWRMFLDYPLFGTGDIDLHSLYITYTQPIDAAEGGHLHNNFVMLLVTLGIFGFACVMALFVKIFRVEWAGVRGTGHDWLYGSVALGCLAAYIGFHVNGFFEWNFGDHEIAVFLWFTVGLTLVARRLANVPVTQNSEGTGQKHNLSVIVITHNEERNVSECLRSVAWAREIIVVDARSADKTVELARQFTQRVFVKDWMGFAAAKNFALDQAENTWVLWLDADERVSPELAAEIQRTISDAPTYHGYEIGRRAYFLGKWIRHCGWYPGYVTRLFKRDRARFNDARVHERLELDGKVGRLNNDLLHYTDDTLFHYFEKFNRYTSLAAKDVAEAGKKFSLYDVLARPPYLFFKMYVLRMGFLDGMHGLILCLASAAYVFVKYAKLWQFQIAKK